jgi:two-component system, chemotaxis family, CheB/CheR fusion protein
MTISDQDREFEALLEFLKTSRGFDFTGYKRPSLERRINKRMQEVGIHGYGQYLDYLQVHPDEFNRVFDYILINVTGFFRDPQIWEYLIDEIAPRIVKAKNPDDPIRAWSAGCASGQEAYSIAMVLAESLGPEAYPQRVKIYGTDVDEDALAQARLGVYSAKDVEPVPQELRDRYFEEGAAGYTFDRDLRRSVIFGRHDLVQDAPISRVDLIVCRNTLMYLNAETQGKVMDHFRFALNEGGYLLLGKAEMLFTQTRAFTPVDLKRRIFTKSSVDGERRLLPTLVPDDHGLPAEGKLGVDVAFDSSAVAQVLIDRDGTLAAANQRARAMFRIPPHAIGRSFHDVELSYRPVELRSRLEDLARDRQAIAIKEVRWEAVPGIHAALNVELIPLFHDGLFAGTAITFIDVTEQILLRETLDRVTQELETAMEELQSTNEELETTNEELQSTNEELETTNEELQSTNEELETMNEELQSTNEELQTTNDEMGQRSVELDESNAFLQSILQSVTSAVIVMDEELRVQAWNERAAELWGLRSDEVAGRSLFGLGIGLPVEELRSAIRRSLTDQSARDEITVEAVNRVGQTVDCRVTVSPLLGPQGRVRGVILLVETASERER